MTTIAEGLTNKVLGQWKGLQTRHSDMPKPRKDDDSRNRMVNISEDTENS